MAVLGTACSGPTAQDRLRRRGLTRGCAKRSTPQRREHRDTRVEVGRRPPPPSSCRRTLTQRDDDERCRVARYPRSGGALCPLLAILSVGSIDSIRGHAVGSVAGEGLLDKGTAGAALTSLSALSASPVSLSRSNVSTMNALLAQHSHLLSPCRCQSCVLQSR
jgi:hypothetical protein